MDDLAMDLAWQAHAKMCRCASLMKTSEKLEVTDYFEQKWKVIRKVITTWKNVLEPHRTAEQEMGMYTAVYDLTFNHGLKSYYCQQLHKKCRESLRESLEHITITVLPALREQQGQLMLRELLKQWNNHETLVQRIVSRIFEYPNRDSSIRMQLSALKEDGVMCFQNLICKVGEDKVDDALFTATFAMICLERGGEGEQIDQYLALFTKLQQMFVSLRICNKSLQRLASEAWLSEQIKAKFKVASSLPM